MAIGNPVFDLGESGGGGAFSNVESLQVTIPGDGVETSFYLTASHDSVQNAFVFQFESAPSGDVPINIVIASASSATFDTTTAGAGSPPGGVA